MKKLLIVAPAALALGLVLMPAGNEAAFAAASDAPSWAIQPGGSLTFAVAQDGSDIEGLFKSWDGEIRFDPDAPGDAAIRIEIDLTSGTVNDGFKDSLLQGDEFFDTAVTPTATFTSTNVEALPDGRFVAHGDLSLRSLSIAQDVEFRLTGSGDTRHVEGQATIDRMGYGIGNGSHGDGLDKAVGVNFAFDAMRG